MSDGFHALADLRAAFPHSNVPTSTLELYKRHLADLPLAVFDQVVTRLIRTEEHFPTVAKIRRDAAELALGLPSEAEALTQIESREITSPLVRDCLRRVGGVSAWRASEEPTVIRGQFLRLYREAREAEITALAVGERPFPDGRRTLPVS